MAYSGCRVGNFHLKTFFISSCDADFAVGGETLWGAQKFSFLHLSFACQIHNVVEQRGEKSCSARPKLTWRMRISVRTVCRFPSAIKLRWNFSLAHSNKSWKWSELFSPVTLGLKSVREKKWKWKWKISQRTRQHSTYSSVSTPPTLFTYYGVGFELFTQIEWESKSDGVRIEINENLCEHVVARWLRGRDENCMTSDALRFAIGLAPPKEEKKRNTQREWGVMLKSRVRATTHQFKSNSLPVLCVS